MPPLQPPPQQTAGVVGSGRSFSFSLSSFYETSRIQPVKKEVKMSKAQSGVTREKAAWGRGEGFRSLEAAGGSGGGTNG